MMRRQVGVALALVVCSALFLAVPVMGLGVGAPAQVDNETENGSFGQQVSAFMQTSAADANTSVDSGMWQASVNQTLASGGDPEPKVASRVARLERKLQRLQNRSDRLAAKRDQQPVTYAAQASALREQISNLKADINATARTATRVGANTSRLDRLRTAAGNATGPEISAIARTITDAPRGPPAAVPGGGPPDEAGPGNGNPPATAGNQTEAGPGNGNPPAMDGNRTMPGGQAPASQSNASSDAGDPPTNRTDGSAQSPSGDDSRHGDGGDNRRGDGASQSGSGDDSSGSGTGSSD